MLNEIYAYIAGLFDGEGSIMLVKDICKKSGKVYYRPMVCMGLTDIEPLERLQQLYGGKIHTRKRQKENHRILYQWSIGSKADVIKILTDILPFLVIKKMQAKLMLSYFDEFKSYTQGKKDTDIIKESRERYYLIMSIINGRGEDNGLKDSVLTLLQGSK